jgi:hypothetical protein
VLRLDVNATLSDAIHRHSAALRPPPVLAFKWDCGVLNFYSWGRVFSIDILNIKRLFGVGNCTQDFVG